MKWTSRAGSAGQSKGMRAYCVVAVEVDERLLECGVTSRSETQIQAECGMIRMLACCWYLVMRSLPWRPPYALAFLPNDRLRDFLRLSALALERSAACAAADEEEVDEEEPEVFAEVCDRLLLSCSYAGTPIECS